jgi:hypothetical protein
MASVTDLFGFPLSDMPRTLIPARTQATASVAALLATVALAASASPAGADVEIPLDGAISPQYHVPDVAAVAGVAAPAEMTPPPVEPAPTAEPAPAPVEEPPAVPQYHPENASGNSEGVSENGAPPAAEPEPAPEAPAPEAPAAAPADAPAPAPELPLDLPVHVPDVPPIDVPGEPEPDEHDAEPVATPDVEAAPIVPAVPPAGNVNISIRIFSPGDNGPVTQTGGSGSGSTPDSTPAPTTWIWNWTWSGAPGCDPASGAGIVPPVGDWTWNWTWTCAGVDVPLPGPGGLPGFDMPGIDKLPVMDAGFGRLVPIASVPGLVPGPDVGDLAPLLALGPPPPAGRERAPASRERAVAAGALVPAAPTPASARVLAAFTSPTAPETATNRAGARRRGRDTTRPPGAISAQQAPIGVPIAAAAATAAAASAGASPALLATLICLLISFLAGTLLEVAGLPRLLLRASRLERPG